MSKIFQSELATRAFCWTLMHRRRELLVGWPAVTAIIGTRSMFGLANRLLGQLAVQGQQTDEPLPPDRKDNLYAPVALFQGTRLPSTIKSKFRTRSSLEVQV